MFSFIYGYIPFQLVSTFVTVTLFKFALSISVWKILILLSALGDTVEVSTPALANTTNELGQNIDGMNNGGAPVFVSNDSSSQVVNNSSSRANINISKNTNPPDTTINAMKPKLRTFGTLTN